jgi:hypothetical protein
MEKYIATEFGDSNTTILFRVNNEDSDELFLSAKMVYPNLEIRRWSIKDQKFNLIGKPGSLVKIFKWKDSNYDYKFIEFTDDKTAILWFILEYGV